MRNTLIIAAAGSGKTTFLIKKALEITDKKVLITTFTEANEQEIHKIIREQKGVVPQNVVVQTWFSFLIEHGVKPYQSFLYNGAVTGLELVNQRSGRKYYNSNKYSYYKESEVEKYYFNSKKQIYSDKLAKFVCKVNEIGKGLVIDRLSRVYPYIFIDEVQDLAGYDLELLKLFMQSSAHITMVGDPRQVTYHTHEENKYKKYNDGKIKEFILHECQNLDVKIDEESRCVSFRNKKDICQLANQLYPNLPPCKYSEARPTNHDGVFFVYEKDVKRYLQLFSPMQLRYDVRIPVDENYDVTNFGNAKGSTFDRVLIYPTKKMLNWLLDHSCDLSPKTRSRLYVAITRARHSIGIVYKRSDAPKIEGIQQFR